MSLGIVVGVVGFVLTLWDLSLNSAAIWTGFTCFIGAYGFATRDDASPRARFVLTFASEELRQQWVASAIHQKVWPTVENTLKSKNYVVLLFDSV